MPFQYFGGKRRIASTYPHARRDTIIEPFAGGAAYSLRGDHWTKNVILYDTYLPVIRVWRWLQTVEPQDILSLPDISSKEAYPAEHDSPAYWIMRWAGSTVTNVNKVSPFAAEGWPVVRDRTAASLHKIRHWRIIHGDYRDAPDIEATWFIDPPYQHQGHLYKNGSDGIDYKQLADWVRTRRGQVIVCEQEPADWLPFEHHTSTLNQRVDPTSELIWTNEPALRLF